MCARPPCRYASQSPPNLHWSSRLVWLMACSTTLVSSFFGKTTANMELSNVCDCPSPASPRTKLGMADCVTTCSATRGITIGLQVDDGERRYCGVNELTTSSHDVTDFALTPTHSDTEADQYRQVRWRQSRLVPPKPDIPLVAAECSYSDLSALKHRSSNG